MVIKVPLQKLGADNLRRMQGMSVKNNNKSAFGAIFSFWFFSCLTILASSIVAVVLYRNEFSGGFSEHSSDWGNFGGYIGGVFGPVVSFVTLLAVLKTVYLQRELLDTQDKEFKIMNELQRDTFNAQQQQIQGAADDSRKLQVSASRDTAIKVIDQQIMLREREFERKDEEARNYYEKARGFSSGPIVENYNRASREMWAARRSIERLLALSIKIATTEYFTVDDVRKDLILGLEGSGIETKT
jgi:uncharacterized membrane protein